MEYEIIIHNVFATFDVVNQLAGRGSLLSFIEDSWITRRSFMAGNFDPHLSSSALAQLSHFARTVVHSTHDFTVYEISSRGSFATDYFHLPDKRVLVYERRIKFAY